MLSFLLGLIPGALSTVNGITNAIANERIALLNAQTDQEKIRTQERITSLEAKRDVLVEDSKHSSVDIWIRAGFAAGPLVYLNKIFIYDKALGWGTTDKLDDNLWIVVLSIVGFYTLHSIASMFRR